MMSFHSAEMPMQVLSLEGARNRGERRYFTGKPCARGHVAARLVDSRKCCECHRLIKRKHYQKNKEKILQQTADWAKRNPQKRASIAARSRLNNMERVVAYKRATAAVTNASTAMRRALKLRATPKWADMARIREIYIHAKALGRQVDHVIPLRGRLVCGLHVETNLQILSREENLKKSNNFLNET